MHVFKKIKRALILRLRLLSNGVSSLLAVQKQSEDVLKKLTPPCDGF